MPATNELAKGSSVLWSRFWPYEEKNPTQPPTASAAPVDPAPPGALKSDRPFCERAVLEMRSAPGTMSRIDSSVGTMLASTISVYKRTAHRNTTLPHIVLCILFILSSRCVLSVKGGLHAKDSTKRNSVRRTDGKKVFLLCALFILEIVLADTIRL